MIAAQQKAFTIDEKHPMVSTSRLGMLRLDEREAAAIYKAIQQTAKLRNLKMIVSEYDVTFSWEFFYGNDPVTNEPRYGTQHASFEQLIEKLVRVNNIKIAKQNKIRSALSHIENDLARYREVFT